MKIFNGLLIATIIALIVLIAYLIIGYFAISNLIQEDTDTMLPFLKKVTDINLIENNTLIASVSVYHPTLKVYATITAFNPVAEQCDSTPDIMASGARVYVGAIACPRALEFGTRVEIDGKIYICEDRTAKRYDGRYDILMFDYEEAIEFGKQEKEVLIY